MKSPSEGETPLLNRRQALTRLALPAWAALARAASADAAAADLRAIPSTGERLPAVGMGTWITFNVGRSEQLRAARCRVLEAFFARGGSLVDSSPMYGSAEEVLGHCLSQLPAAHRLFSATKVWTRTRSMGERQMEQSLELWRQPRIDLMQVHNLVDWSAHLETMAQWKRDGRIRYLGITTSHGLRHAEFLELMGRLPLDFVQFTYNIVAREAERELLPLARERGLAVLANRPFRGGRLFDAVAGMPLPDWCAGFDCRTWAAFFLKFILSHPAVTCAIPATSRVDHMHENMDAMYGRLPDPEMRRRMAALVDAL